ncbi:hypothetical protein GCM10025768_01330 [Microbacterium pseudoresistens]|uniref:Tetratricopeptide (TPR) repeat protein n=1 Tax=Microbacterium pseudoresistens TaxID=640634 RepID=A0A7Y9EU27_9MICO|nr:tetratricopeptide repeat protein [Microbacterium pseudoresistens]NYD53968.1 tetratricopeptide (TPR) repeat protein [Microbacterium pseudoresistens]
MSTDARTAAEALIAANRTRRRIRLWIGIALAPFLLAALLLSGKLLSMYAFAYQSISSYVAGDHSGSIRAAEGLQPFNWFEPYKAPYDLGVGLAASGRLDEAEARFEDALALAHGTEVCAVRINLALVLEWQGDAAVQDGDPVRAQELYGRALVITAETPDECRDDQAQEDSPDPNRDMSDTLDEQQQRLQEKQQQSSQDPSQPDPDEEEPQDQPDQSDLDDLEDRLRQGEQERQQNERDQNDDGSGGTDRPW